MDSFSKPPNKQEIEEDQNVQEELIYKAQKKDYMSEGLL